MDHGHFYYLVLKPFIVFCNFELPGCNMDSMFNNQFIITLVYGFFLIGKVTGITIQQSRCK